MQQPPAEPVVVLLGLGANLGAPDEQLRRALDRLAQVPGIRVDAVSSFRTTAPVGGPPQPDFRNGVARLVTTLSPHTLLGVLKAIEREAGRDPHAERFGPRPLDLDILTYGDLMIDTRDLQVPHPRLAEREFVTVPLVELGVDLAALPARVAPPLVDRVPQQLAARCDSWRRGACTVGLVPTMGALHDGHAQLLRRARAECDRVVATIFVNPLQFAPHEDLSRYPRPFEADLSLCAREGVDVVFQPSVEAVYGAGFCSRIAVGAEAVGMEADARPGHFVGVATVVARLWSLVVPDRAYFGRKDAQQVAVLRRLHQDLGLSGTLIECPTVREADGLARSSRNVYLAPEDRAAAPVIVRALRAAHAAHAAGEHDAAALVAIARAHLRAEPRCRSVDYVELRRDDDLLPWPVDRAVDRARLLIAARFGEPATRLLDNLTLGAEPA